MGIRHDNAWDAHVRKTHRISGMKKQIQRQANIKGEESFEPNAPDNCLSTIACIVIASQSAGRQGSPSSCRRRRRRSFKVLWLSQRNFLFHRVPLKIRDRVSRSEEHNCKAIEDAHIRSEGRRNH
jgi:hypothetical protein